MPPPTKITTKGDLMLSELFEAIRQILWGDKDNNL